MKNVLYYPGFESNDINFLKMALLYFSDLRTIVPPAGRYKLSRDFNFVCNESNLLNTYLPRMLEADIATEKTIEKLNLMFKHNRLYVSVFGLNYLEKWKIKDNHTMEIFRDKYNDELVRFLIENKLCTRNENGILLDNDLGLLFMSYLAFAIRDQNKFNIMSDVDRASRISALVEVDKSNLCDVHDIKAIQKLISLRIPTNLSEIPLTKIIDLRNSNGYLENLESFHKSVDKYLNTNNLSEINILSMLNEIEEKEMELDIGSKLSTAFGTLGFIIGAYKACAVSGIDVAELECLISLGVLVGNGITQFHSTQITDDEDRAKSYLAQLSSLK